MNDSTVSSGNGEGSVQTTSSADISLSSGVAESAPAASAPVSNWRDSLPAELKDSNSLKSFKDLGDLAKSYEHLNGMLGKRWGDLTAEEMSMFHSKQGKPTTKEGYQFPEGMNNDQANWLKDIAHKNNLTQDQAKQMADSFIMHNRDQSERATAEANLNYESAVNDLKKEFGTAFDKRIEIAKRAVNQFGGAELASALKQAGLDNNPLLVKTFAQIGQKLLADTIVDADKSNSFGTTPAEAQRSIREISSKYSDVLLNPRHPEHTRIKSELDGLYQTAYAGDDN